MVEWLKHGQSHVGDQELQRLWHQYAKVVEYKINHSQCEVPGDCFANDDEGWIFPQDPVTAFLPRGVKGSASDQSINAQGAIFCAMYTVQRKVLPVSQLMHNMHPPRFAFITNSSFTAWSSY